MREVGIKDGKYIRISPGIVNKVGRDGVAKWIIGELEAHFRE